MKNTSVRSRSRYVFGFALLFALLLNLNLTSQAFAAPNAIVNGDFGGGNMIDPCNYRGWDVQGNVTLVAGAAERIATTDRCVAKTAGDRDNTVSRLSQTFTVPGSQYAPQLRFNFWARSDNGGKLTDPDPRDAYLPQSITLYDANGNIIYSKSRNVDTGSDITGRFKIDLSPYRGQTLTLEIKVSVDPKDPTSPGAAALYIDKVAINEFYYNPGEENYAW